MIVADASVVLAAVVAGGRARAIIQESNVHVPHLIDAEVAHGLRRMAARGEISESHGALALETVSRLGLMRHATFSMADRVWELRHNLTAYDATYVALAETIECPLVTGDGPLSRAPGIFCDVTLLPS